MKIHRHILGTWPLAGLLPVALAGCLAGNVGMDDDASTALPRSDAGWVDGDGSAPEPDAQRPPFCGDDICQPDENPVDCPDDCFAPGASPAVTVGGYHSCARTGASTAWCWGYNRYGQLGDGSTDDQDQPHEVTGLTGVTDLSAGHEHTCAAVGEGEVWCWGRNKDGRLGQPANVELTSVPLPVNGLADVVTLSAGGRHTCAVRADQTAWCWGANTFGQLGDGSLDPHATPTPVSGLPAVVAISAGGQHTCGLQATGEVWCWGRNDAGQLGDGADTSAQLPGLVAILPKASQLATGTHHTCALLAEGSVRCWGDNRSAQLGLEGVDHWQIPSPLGDLPATAVGAGDGQSCLVHPHGSLWCFGAVGLGEAPSAVAVEVTPLSQVVHVDLGQDHGCALVAGGSLYCWGGNTLGQLGDGTSVSTAAPVRVSGF